jgi:hypothetical protein
VNKQKHYIIISIIYLSIIVFILYETTPHAYTTTTTNKQVREHHVLVDPACMIAVMSMMVLVGWQVRLAPEISVMGSIESSMGGNTFGFVNKYLPPVSSLTTIILPTTSK